MPLWQNTVVLSLDLSSVFIQRLHFTPQTPPSGGIFLMETVHLHQRILLASLVIRLIHKKRLTSHRFISIILLSKNKSLSARGMKTFLLSAEHSCSFLLSYYNCSYTGPKLLLLLPNRNWNTALFLTAEINFKRCNLL